MRYHTEFTRSKSNGVGLGMDTEKNWERKIFMAIKFEFKH